MEDQNTTMTVKFEQEITIQPPDGIKDQIDAKYWFQKDPNRLLEDAIDIRHGEVNIISFEDEDSMSDLPV